MTLINRRNFVKSSAGFSLASVLGVGGAFQSFSAPSNIDGMGKIKNIGVQLYTVRDHMANNVEDTVSKVAEFGYKEVEFAGYFGRSAKTIRNILNVSGLVSPSVHIGLNDIEGDNFKALIENAATIGHKYITIAGFDGAHRETLDQLKNITEIFNKAGEECKKGGVQFAYHNHEFEFEAVEGVEPYDMFLKDIDQDLMVMEMDLFWITKAGRNPFTYFDRSPGRFHMCHVKDMAGDGSMVDVGEGYIDFAKIFAASEKAGLKHYFVEHDNPKSSMESIKFSCETLQQMKVGI